MRLISALWVGQADPEEGPEEASLATAVRIHKTRSSFNACTPSYGEVVIWKPCVDPCVMNVQDLQPSALRFGTEIKESCGYKG